MLICSLYICKNIINNRIIEEILRYLINPIEGIIPDENNLELISVLLNEINCQLIKTNFWNKFTFEIKKSLKFLMKDKKDTFKIYIFIRR